MRLNQEMRIKNMKETAEKALKAKIISFTPISREQSLAITKLDECLMWAEQAIIRNEK